MSHPAVGRAVLIILLATLPLQACAQPGSAVEGQVLEEGTNKPVAGVVVVGLWQGIVSHGFVESRTVCYHVESSETDATGNFRLPPTEKEKKYRRKHHYTSLYAYKAGYEHARTVKTTVYLKPFMGTREEKMKYLLRVLGAVGCGAQDESEKSLIPLLTVLYEEAQRLAQTKEDKKIVETILYDLEIKELGFESAEKRHLKRVQ